MAFIYSLTDTWNNGATTFTGIGLNVTDSASAAGSLLLNLQVGGVSRFSVLKGSATTTTIRLASNGGNADITAVGNTLDIGTVTANHDVALPGATFQRLGAGGGVFVGTGALANSPALYGSVQEANHTLAQRNGTNAQTLRVYNTFTDAANYERISFGWSANVFTIGRESAGTGVARNMQLVGGGSVLGIGPAASAAVDWTFSAGNLLAGTDNTRDIGASGASRPRNLYMASWIRMATTTVASLPAAATAGAGARMFVTDASTPTFGSAVVGGGAVTVPVYSTGSAWNVG